MRLLTLEFQALGPFAGHHQIDFTRFEPSGLYLLRGQTGSGKSTIIDAITFALYGNVAGGQTSTRDRLRSNFASRNTDTFVRLRFETSHGAFEVTRRPAYVKEGNKTPTPASATLVKLDSSYDPDSAPFVGTGEEVATRASAVTDEITRVVGLGLDQFLQTVVLPQGKFASFIHSSPSERKDVLEDIFGTVHFRRFTESLTLQSKAARAEFDEQRNAVAFQAGQICEEAATAVRLANYEEAIGYALTISKELEAEARQAEDRLFRAVADVREIEATEAERERVETTTLQWNAARKQLAELEQTAGEHKQREAELKHAREALALNADLLAKERATTALEQAKADAASSIDAINEEDADLRSTARGAIDGSSCEAIRKRDEELTRELTRLEETEQNIERLEQLSAQVEQLGATIVELEQSASEHQARIDQFKQVEQNAEAAVAQMEQQGRSYTGLLDQKNELSLRLDASKSADKERAHLLEISEEIGHKAKELEQARTQAQGLAAKWINNSALELAAKLVDGEECIVCGSTNHPHPHEGSPTDIQREEVDEARVLVARIEASLTATREDHQRIVEAIKELNQKAGADTASLQIAYDDIDAQVVAAKQAGDIASQLRKDLAESRVQVEEYKTQIASDQAKIAANTKDVENKTAEIERLSQLVEQARGSFTSVAERRESIATRQNRIRHIVEAITAFEDARNRHADAVAVLDEALANSTFASANEVQEALLPQAEINALEEQISNYNLTKRQAGAAIEETERSGLVRTEYPKPLTNALSRLRRIHEEATSTHALAKNALTQHEGQAGKLRAGIENLQTLEKELGPIRRLAELAQGARLEDGTPIPFDTWVIMRQFERVLEAANPYILEFSNERYQLRRVSLDASRKSQHAGLGLAVIDLSTDTERSPASLSGGETFYSSLALALGLVEVISSEAGGLDLKSMLIDEGFGSLDQDALDKVMNGLQRLRASGRTVGVVSHVAEMQQRISDGIEIKHAKSKGSTLVIHAAD
ncbi:AAA family ATPase [Actinomyces urinae]|uniref:AAA family ATPase n=1 Tax=Actinomyces urinae TaxID=1689268 RepID=UPI000931B0D3|nr:SMC family ATPase [Actinomyces urinae]